MNVYNEDREIPDVATASGMVYASLVTDETVQAMAYSGPAKTRCPDQF